MNRFIKHFPCFSLLFYRDGTFEELDPLDILINNKKDSTKNRLTFYTQKK